MPRRPLSPTCWRAAHGRANRDRAGRHTGPGGHAGDRRRTRRSGLGRDDGGRPAAGVGGRR
ncbi:hypothetical protein DLJ57_01160, partial [Micromonospora chalcea]